MESFDKTDAKILFELDRNCRQTQKQIAKRAGVSRDVVLHRVRKLEAAGIVKGYYTLIDFSKLGYTLVRVYLKLQNATEKIEKQITDYLVKENTITVYKTSAGWDLAAGFLVRSLKEFDEMWTNFLKKFKSHIKEKTISVFYGFAHYARNYLAPEKQRDYSEAVIGGSEKVQLSESDLKLLQLIAANGKISLIELAKQMKISAPAVRQKMRSLENKKVILGYRATIDLNKIGYEYYKVDVELNDIAFREAIRKFLRFHPNVVYEDITFGGSDLEFDLEVKRSDEFEKFMALLKEKFPRAIKFFSFYKAREILKYLYMPPS